MTLPLSVFFVVWLALVVRTYLDFGIRYNTYAESAGLSKVMKYEFDSLMQEGSLAMFGSKPSFVGSSNQVHLMVRNDAEHRLNSDLPYSGRDYVDGYLQYPGGSLGKVSLRYRGDFFWHWAMKKKSWRVKTSKAAMWNGMRKFNLIVPKSLSLVVGDLGYWLARDMELIAPESDVVELWINGESRGVHTLVEQLEELVLRKNGRMPGDLFAGEMLGRDSHMGVPGRIFQFPWLWSKVAINNHFDAEARDALVRLSELLQEEPSEALYFELRTLLNYEAFGKFTAYRMLTQSRHYDNVHNWRLYYDPWRNRFEPVVWDPNAWHKPWVPRVAKNAFELPTYCELDNVLALDSQFRLETNRQLGTYLQSGALERLLRHFDESCADIKEAADRDPALGQYFVKYPNGIVAPSQAAFRRDLVLIYEEFSDRHVNRAPTAYQSILWDGNGQLHVRIALGDYQGIEGVELNFAKPLLEPPTVLIGYESKTGERGNEDVGEFVRVDGGKLRIDVPLLPGFSFDDPLAVSSRGYNPEIRTYDISIKFEGEQEPGYLGLKHISMQGALGRPELLESMGVAPFKDEFGVLVLGTAGVQPREIWSGTLEISGQRTVTTPVLIEAGTVLDMTPGASLVFEAQVTVQGTASQPVIVKPAKKGQEPWGVFAVRGAGADWSSFDHVRFEGGSGWKRPMVEYSAMVSVHDADQVAFRRCNFKDSKIVDDMVHAVYSEGLSFVDCFFLSSAFDALDVDISSVTVDRCKFSKSGNDSIDLMTSRAIVTNTLVQDSIDKAISVGEGTHVLLTNNLFKRCEIGVQAKDGSSALMVNCDFLENKMAVDAYKKNWRYNDGGEIHMHKCWFKGNDQTLSVDKNSVAFVSDCGFGETGGVSGRHIYYGANEVFDGDGGGRKALAPGLSLVPGEPSPKRDFMGASWPLKNAGRRGVRGRAGLGKEVVK